MGHSTCVNSIFFQPLRLRFSAGTVELVFYLNEMATLPAFIYSPRAVKQSPNMWSQLARKQPPWPCDLFLVGKLGQGSTGRIDALRDVPMSTYTCWADIGGPPARFFLSPKHTLIDRSPLCTPAPSSQEPANRVGSSSPDRSALMRLVAGRPWYSN